LEAGCTLIKDGKQLQNTFSYHPDYYNFDMEKVNFFDYGIQNSRGFKALKVWLSLSQLGRQGYIKTIQEDIDLAEYAFKLLHDHREFEALSWNLSITTFRYFPEGLKSIRDNDKVEKYLDKLNKLLLEQIEKNGEMFLSNAVLQDVFYLRMCIVNFRTQVRDIQFMVNRISEMGKVLDKNLRKELGDIEK
jgi:glutamate/tyrosine decarboxylase-like PLP-dependent enzyme